MTANQWTIRRVMIVIAGLSPLLALARYPFAFGFVMTIGLMACFVGWNARQQRYDRITGFLLVYPAFPLLMLYLMWWLIKGKYVRKSSMGLLDGIFAVSDIGGYLCIMAYMGCLGLLLSGVIPRTTELTGGLLDLRRAAKRVALLMPLTWGAFLFFALRDPFGVLGYFFR